MDLFRRALDIYKRRIIVQRNSLEMRLKFIKIFDTLSFAFIALIDGGLREFWKFTEDKLSLRRSLHLRP